MEPWASREPARIGVELGSRAGTPGSPLVDGDDWDAGWLAAAMYAWPELPADTPRSNATNCGACGSTARQTMENAPTRPRAGFQTRVATGRFLSRICASRTEASWARCTAAWAIDHRRRERRCARFFSSSETRQLAYPWGLAVSASTASSQAISRSTESRFSIHHTAG